MEQKDKLKQRHNAQSSSQTDKEYYSDLYQDLPQEVQDILMQTHPLMGKNDKTEKTEKTDKTEKTAKGHRTRRPQREDVEEVREARMQQVSSEINQIKNAPPQEGAPTRYVSRRERSLEHTHHPEAPAHKMEEDDDEIQYVSVLPARKKSKITEEVTIQTAAPSRAKPKKSKKAKPRKEPEEMPFTDLERAGGRPRYEEWDFDERIKQEQLDRLYEEDDYDDDEFRIGKGKFPIIVGIVGLVLIIFLIFHSISLRSQLQDAQNQLSAVEDLQQRYEQVQLEKMQLQEQLDAIQNPEGATQGNDSTTEGGDTTSNETATDNQTTQSNTTTTEGGEEYIVQEGETPWSMAQKFYGNGAEYQRILDANGLTEDSSIRPGDRLIIPAA